ncbi:heterokaryon incompatibility protein-domain-containing protein [Stachybotrys elegans]|uniref:Heterokaryon incompatibility protein-domain-containing protein n=1 Tax=Stachybotrys elegans TaxID=80388 RepID=A0A8K0SNF6_9HYPO|nr:heterokaryon incompatibility protein-domain-containing protein [Stachybotrys elegans]
MASYVYTQLQATPGDLRLVLLQPGGYHDDLRCNILHYPLLEPKILFKDERLPVKDVQKSLPDGWTVEQTLDGRYLFMSPRHSGIPNSWKHPDAGYDPKSYELPVYAVSDSFEWHVPPYDALSYSWGTAGDEEYIHITDSADTQNPPAWLKIRQNLAAALRHLRYPDQPRTLWVDAICINQADIEERGRQVKRMGQIYPLSQKVIIWLGPESEDSKHALETLEYFSQQVEYIISHRWGDAPGAQEPDWWRDGVALPYDEKTWNSILSLLHRPWFERVWVLQEALSCDRVVLQCGRDTISWVHVRKALLVLRQKAGILPLNIRDRLFAYARGLMAPPLASSEHLFLWTRNQKCSDPRDKVYGILGLLDPNIVAKIEVDYSTPAWKTYSQLVLAEMEAYQKLNMINHCNMMTRLEGFPSWVPNLERPIEGANTGYLSIRRFYASARSSAVARLVEPDNHLQVTARRVSTISRVSQDLTGTFVQVFQVIRNWAPKDPGSSMYVSGGLSMDAYVEVLVRGRTSDRALSDNPCPSIRRLRELLTSALASTQVGDDVARAFKDCFFASECLFATADGYVGVSAIGVREGDQVAIILGCDFPIVIRPRGSDRYEVVGPCFVHGLMLGEALKPPLDPPWRDALPVTKGWALPYFINTETGELLKSDPRLGSLPPGWEEVASSDPFLPPFVFQNKADGRISVNDPRMSADAIRQRGIELETLVLV